MQPDDLSPVEEVEFAEIVWSAVDLGHVADVGALVVERLGQADVEVGGQDRAGESAQDQFGQMAVAAPQSLRGCDQVEENLLPVGLRPQQMLNGKGKILAEPVWVADEPGLTRQPSHPLRCCTCSGGTVEPSTRSA